MLQRPKGQPAATLASLGEGPRIPVENYHQYVLQALTSRAKRYFRTDAPPARGSGV